MTSTRTWRRWPLATAAVVAVTVSLTVLQFPFPGVRLALWRDPAALAAGQWWRLATPLLVQYDAVWQIVVVLALLAAVGVAAERIFGPARSLEAFDDLGLVDRVLAPGVIHLLIRRWDHDRGVATWTPTRAAGPPRRPLPSVLILPQWRTERPLLPARAPRRRSTGTWTG